jgi:hypothetical protein
MRVSVDKATPVVRLAVWWFLLLLLLLFFRWWLVIMIRLADGVISRVRQASAG